MIAITLIATKIIGIAFRSKSLIIATNIISNIVMIDKAYSISFLKCLCFISFSPLLRHLCQSCVKKLFSPLNLSYIRYSR